MALDAKTGTVRWRFRVPPPENAILGHATSRGVALYEDKVYFASIHAVLYALDARTGREVWKTTVADNSQGYYMTLAPLVAGGKVMVGARDPCRDWQDGGPLSVHAQRVLGLG